jgi:hypothetical protein
MRKQLKHFSKPNAGYDILEIVVEGKGKAKAEE